MCEVCKIDGDVMLLVGQFAVVTLQVVPVTGILRLPLHLVATVLLSGQFGVTSLRNTNEFHF